MMSRLMLAILLLASHTLTLRAAIAPQTQGQQQTQFEPCCPLCVPADDDAPAMGCGCGCGTIEQDPRVPSSPSELPAIVNTQHAIPAPQPQPFRTIACENAGTVRLASISDDAEGHSSTNRFLARIGVWLN